MEFAVVAFTIFALTALAASNFERSIVQAQISEGFSLSTGVQQDLTVYYAQHGRWPERASDTFSSALLADESLGAIVENIDLHERGTISIVFKGQDERVALAIAGGRLSMRPATLAEDVSATIVWVCAKKKPPAGMVIRGDDITNIDSSLLPSSCRNF